MTFPTDTKPNQSGSALTKRKDRTKKNENGHAKDSLRPNSPRADKSDASDNDMNGDAEDLDVSLSPIHGTTNLNNLFRNLLCKFFSFWESS